MKDLRAEKEQLTIQKDAQYDTYHYFKDYHKELQTVCANVDSILGAEQEVQQHEQQHTRNTNRPSNQFSKSPRNKNSQRIMWSTQYAGYSFHLLLVPQHTIF